MNRINRTLSFVYGVGAYAISLGVFVWLAGFLLNVGVPRSIDRPAADSPQSNLPVALAIDLGLLLLFGLQHSIMARPTFKQAWTRLVPEPIERSTYVLASCVVLVMLFWLWRPMPAVLWQAPAGLLAGGMLALHGLGWAIVLASTFLLNHFDLFGLRQVWLHFRIRPYDRLRFRVPIFYRFVRHPLYVGWLLVFWCAPAMTAGRLLFAAGLTAYILVAIYFEERNLLEVHGADYAEYRRQVPMLIPIRMPAGAQTAVRVAVAVD